MTARRISLGLLALLLVVVGLFCLREKGTGPSPREQAAVATPSPTLSSSGSLDSRPAGSAHREPSRLSPSRAGFRPDRSGPSSSNRPLYRFVFVGNESVPSTTLREQVELPSPAPEPDEIRRLVSTALSDYYKRRGYLEFQIERIEVQGDEPTEVQVVLEEGIAYRFGQVVVRQGQALADRISRDLPRRGAPADLETLREVKEELVGGFRDQGYLGFRFEFMWAKDPEVGEVDMVLHFERGDRFTIRDVLGPSSLPTSLNSLRGLSFDRDLVERRLRNHGLSWADVELKQEGRSSVDLVVRDTGEVP